MPSPALTPDEHAQIISMVFGKARKSRYITLNSIAGFLGITAPTAKIYLDQHKWEHLVLQTKSGVRYRVSRASFENWLRENSRNTEHVECPD